MSIGSLGSIGSGVVGGAVGGGVGEVGGKMVGGGVVGMVGAVGLVWTGETDGGVDAAAAMRVCFSLSRSVW